VTSDLSGKAIDWTEKRGSYHLPKRRNGYIGVFAKSDHQMFLKLGAFETIPEEGIWEMNYVSA
tara:strand:+ start:753 stop:941 length:189 start_codon:yes stop_codon:yes gene_type:complete